MAATLNRIELIGFVGRDPETRYSASGTAIANFSLATTYRRRDASGNYQDETTWHRVSCFAGLAEKVAERARKGSHLYVEGRLTSRQYTDNSGFQRTAFEVVANDVIILDRPSADEDREERPRVASSRASRKSVQQQDEFEEVPF